MATAQRGDVLYSLIRRFADGDAGDGDLLERFAREREEAAFAALVRRHGPMVLGVCRRVLRDAHLAEDAFQATFLVLARKAGSVARPELLGNWLYGVALRTASEARTRAARRRTRELEAMTNSPVPVDSEPDADTAAVLDAAIRRLPERLRAAVVLCELQGIDRREAARRLGCPEGTLSSRLARARDILRRRLLRQGVALSVGSLAVAIAVPVALAETTTRAAVGSIPASASVLALTEGVLRAMFISKLKIAAVPVLTLIVVAGTGIGLLAQGTPGAKPDNKPAAPAAKPGAKPGAPADAPAKLGKAEQGASVEANVKSVDAAKKTITVMVPDRDAGKKSTKEMTYALAGDLKVYFPSDKKGDAPPEAKLADVTENSNVSLRLSPDAKSVVAIMLHPIQLQGTVVKFDAGTRALTILSGGRKDKSGEEHTVTLAEDAQVQLPSFKKGEAKSGALRDLVAGAPVSFSLGADRKTVRYVTLQYPGTAGGVKAVDAAKRTITIGTKGKSGAEESTYAIAADARIALAGVNGDSEGKLGDISEGCQAILQLSLDRKTAQSIHVSGPSMSGIVKGIDAGSRTITITVKEDGNLVDKTFDLAKGLEVNNVAQDDIVSLHLSADQKAVIGVNVAKK
jgi:RNA polymerase sigma factor (sigma-70 family)